MSSRGKNWYWREAKKRSRKKRGLVGYIQEYAHKGIFITPDEYVAMVEQHRGLCGICEQPFVGTPFLDHDHSTGRPRGLLCATCNTGLGCYRDDPALIEKAAAYLRQTKK